MIYILLVAVLVSAVCFGIRFYMLKKALKETAWELNEILQDISQNQVLHLPLPDQDLEVLLYSINNALYKVREERKKYAKREREFQAQIEAISHDLRTPLTVILGYMKFLQTQENYSSYTNEQKEMLETIERKARIMEKLISQFYEYSRLSANDYELALEEVDVGRILREIFTDNCLILEKANLEVKTDLPHHPLYVEGEKAALERIFSNLFQNARRYAHHFLHIAVQEKEKEICIIFENDTKELDVADIPYLFERFYMKDNARNQDGTGLGLTIAKCLAKEMNGKLEAEIVEDGNSSLKLFRLILCLKMRSNSLKEG